MAKIVWKGERWRQAQIARTSEYRALSMHIDDRILDAQSKNLDMEADARDLQQEETS